MVCNAGKFLSDGEMIRGASNMQKQGNLCIEVYESNHNMHLCETKQSFNEQS